MLRINTFHIVCVILSMFTLVVNETVNADSLWQKRVTVNHNLFDDNRGKRVGDIVTVLVVEETNIEGDEESTTDNKGGSSGEVDNNAFLSGILSNLRNGRNARFEDRAANNYSADFNQNFSGEGEYESTRSIELVLTATVVEVLDNGNMLLEGKREIKVNKEKYNLKFTGAARPIDIALDNTILSSQMSNVQFSIEGKGWLTRAGRKGWYHRLVDVFWPF